jgi:hypothetical protein
MIIVADVHRAHIFSESEINLHLVHAYLADDFDSGEDKQFDELH